jgi:MoxR-like ATPase
LQRGLLRRLVRVNFDEALERADFIGGNTIENGTVVWKGGIITQAIQHPGCIVLLDEVGFARPTAVAVLHSLCERSPNRSLTVSETGQRIPVSSGVAFFCADNSNGHGNTSGNFGGVLEQNRRSSIDLATRCASTTSTHRVRRLVDQHPHRLVGGCC